MLIYMCIYMQIYIYIWTRAVSHRAQVDGILQSADKDGKIDLDEFIELLLKPTKTK